VTDSGAPMQKESIMHDHSSKDADRLDREAKELEREAGRLEETAHKIEDHAHDLERQAHELEEEARREREQGDHGHDHGGGDHHHGQSVKITMVVNGQPVTIEATEQEKLSDVRQRALTETQNLAQPPENWEIKNEAGAVLDPDKRVGDYHFGKEVTLFLSLKAGAAGAHVAGR
jgi:predicted ribosome quality control (RQC) complex YloA/Tae2 family protein